MTATVDAVLSTVQGDGVGDGKTITTPAGMTGKRVLAFIGSSTNGDTIGAPASGTWAEVDPSGDKVITTSGGQLRTFEGRNLSSSTAYAFTLSGGRRTIGAVVIGNEDDSGASMVDVSASLESAAASTHAPPSVTPTASSELVVDCLMFRHFAPDTSTGSPPSTGLTWTEDLDTRGADGNNNVQINIAHATAGSSGVAISTAAWNTDDPFEPALVMRVVIKSAAGGTDATATPVAVAAVATLPSPTVSAGSTPTPTAIAATTVLPTATISAGSTTTPAAVTASTTLPQATISAGSTTAPAAVAASTALPSPAVAAGSTATPSAVIAIAALPTATLSASSTASPAPIAAAATLPAAAVSAGATVVPAAIVAAVSLPAPTVDTAGNATVTPAVIAVTVAVQSVALAAGATVSPATVAGLVSVPAGTVQTGDVARLSNLPIVTTSSARRVVTTSSPQRIVTSSGRRPV